MASRLSAPEIESVWDAEKLDAKEMFDAKFFEEVASALWSKLVVFLNDRPPGILPRYLSLETAAIYLDTTEDGVRGMAREHVFPVVKIGGRLRIDKVEIDKAYAAAKTWLNEYEPRLAKKGPAKVSSGSVVRSVDEVASLRCGLGQCPRV